MTLPKLQSLTLSTGSIPSSFLAWIKLNIESLKCAQSPGRKPFAEFLGVCAQNLSELDIDLAERNCKVKLFFAWSFGHPFPPTSDNSQSVQQYMRARVIAIHCSYRLAINSSVKHLVLDIDISLNAFLTSTFLPSQFWEPLLYRSLTSIYPHRLYSDPCPIIIFTG